MTDSTSSEPGSEAPRGPQADGIGSLSAGTLAALLDHLEARADLLRWEAREAKSRLVGRLIFLVSGVAMLLAAYAVGLAALVGWIAQSRGIPWPTVAASVALGHLLIGAILLFLARKRRGENPVFPDSLAEFRRDREALRRRSEATRPRDPR